MLSSGRRRALVDVVTERKMVLERFSNTIGIWQVKHEIRVVKRGVNAEKAAVKDLKKEDMLQFTTTE